MLNRLRKNKLFLTVSLFVGITAFFSAALFHTQNVGAIGDGSSFHFKDIHTITGTSVLRLDTPNSILTNSSIDFIGNYPGSYTTNKFSWLTPTGVSCSGVLVIKVTNLTNENAHGSIDTLNGSESGLGRNDGDSHACRVSVYDNKRDFLINNAGIIHPGSYDFPPNPWAATKNAVCNSDPGTQGACFVNFENQVLACSNYIDPAKSFDERKAMIGRCLKNAYPQAGAQIDQDIANMKQDVAILPSTGPNNAGDLKTSCSIDGIGWIICPAMRFMAKIVDKTYDVVNGMLTINPIGTDTGSPLYTAWATMRSFANVAFVIVFLIIIYSQLTSVGISNYNIKKMLPRLIVAAILVNVSYWLCAIAVDISNIVGQSAKSLLENIPVTVAGGQSNVNTGAGGAWDGLTILAITGVALIFVDIAVLLPMLVMALFAIVTVVLVLTMRQALIIILIVISPLAFVAYLLPNTESLFKKWMDLFKVLLLMFPIIAVIFGGSRLASAILTQASNDPKNIDTNFLLQTMAAGVTIIPLFLTPIVMKAAGGLLNRFGGIVNNPTKGPFDRMRKGAEGIYDQRKVNRNLRALDPNKRSMPGRASFINYRNKRHAISSGRAEQYEDLKKENIANLANDAISGDGFSRKVAGSKAEIYQQKQAQYLASIDPDKLKLELDKSKVANMVGTLNLQVKDPAKKIEEVQQKLIDAAAGGDQVTARAAQEILLNSGSRGIKALEQGLNSVDSQSDVGREMRRDLASSPGIKSKAANVHAWSVDSTGRSLQEVSADSKTWSGLADAEVAGQSALALQSAVNSGGISPEKAGAVLDARGSENIGEDKREILERRAGRVPRGPSSTQGTPAANTDGQSVDPPRT